MSSPPPPNSTATADFLKSMAQRKHSHPSIFYNPQPTSPFPTPHHQATVRGFIPKHQQPNSDHSLPNSGYPYHPYGLLNSDQFINPSSAHLQQTLIGAPTAASANHSKVSVAADNSLKSTRDKNGDDTFTIIRDRKVQVSEGTSLYAQCRSWLKNGLILEKPPQYVDHVKSLPKPLPASVIEPRNDDDVEVEEKTEDVEHWSAKELLQQHVKHAKKVRARLRNQRLQRIERYKDRLALLLPPVVNQQPKTDSIS